MATFCDMAYTWDANKNKTSESITGVMSGYGFTAAGTTAGNEDLCFSSSLSPPASSLLIDIDANGTADVNFQYDALGRRVARSGTGGSVVYVQMDQQTIADYPVGGAATTPTFRYVYASYIDEPVVRKTAGTGGTLVYFHRNQQYSITAVTTSTGSIAERYAYTAYGQPTILDASGTVLQTSNFSLRYSFTGREWDATLSLYHFRARWMSPSAGGGITRDPIGFEGGAFSIVENCHSNPFVYVDPTGEQIRPFPALPWHHTRPPIRLTTLCAGVNACPDCDPTVCAAAQQEIQDAYNAANGAAISTLNGWLVEHGLGSYGGRCHYWSGIFCKDLNCKPIKRGSCLNVTGHVIRLDGGSQYVDHNVNVIRNRCSGKCTVVDDGFWGTLGQVYDPCNVPNPPLVGPIGQGQWDSIRAGCGCAGGNGGGATR